MTLNRYAARTDSTQQEIVSALRAAGASVEVIKTPTDLMVGYEKVTANMEIKRDAKAKHTKRQRDFLLSWRGGPVFTVWDVDGALRALQVMKGGK